MKNLGLVILLALGGHAAFAQQAKVECSATSEKFFVHEGEEGSGPKKKDVIPVKLTARDSAGQYLMGDVDTYNIFIDLSKPVMALYIRPLGGTIMQARAAGTLDADGNGPSLRLQYWNRQVKDASGEPQQATIEVKCSAASK